MWAGIGIFKAFLSSPRDTNLLSGPRAATYTGEVSLKRLQGRRSMAVAVRIMQLQCV